MKTQSVLAVAALVMIFLGFTFLGGIVAGRIITSTHNQRANAAIWHAVLCDIEQRVAKPQKGDQPLSLDRRREIIAYYDTLLVKDAHAAPCGIELPGR